MLDAARPLDRVRRLRGPPPRDMECSTMACTAPEQGRGRDIGDGAIRIEYSLAENCRIVRDEVRELGRTILSIGPQCLVLAKAIVEDARTAAKNGLRCLRTASTG